MLTSGRETYERRQFMADCRLYSDEQRRMGAASEAVLGVSQVGDNGGLLSELPFVYTR